MLSELKNGCTCNCLIVGDFNLPNIDWNLLVGNSSTDNKFVEIFNDCFLTQLVTEPTRNDKILDLALVNNPQIVENIEVGEGLDNSDHSIIRLKIRANKTQINNDRLIPDFAKGDFDKFRRLLSSINWNEKFRDMNAHQMWTAFRNIIDNFQNECVPLKKMRNTKTKKPLWWKASINKALNTKNRLFKNIHNLGF